MSYGSVVSSAAPALREILGREENCECADCTSRSPTYASPTLGVVVCEQCAGIHAMQGMPCRSVQEHWPEEDLTALRAVGNLNAQCYWEYAVPFGEEKPEVSLVCVVNVLSTT